MKLLWGTGLAVAAMMTALAGCEDSRDSHELNQPANVSALGLRPATITLQPAETYAVFTAHGGTPPYRWSVSDSTLGSVPVTHAGTITYTVAEGTLGANVVYVSDQNDWTAQAIVHQVAGTNSL
jgi:hypothetical protein